MNPNVVFWWDVRALSGSVPVVSDITKPHVGPVTAACRIYNTGDPFLLPTTLFRVEPLESQENNYR